MEGPKGLPGLEGEVYYVCRPCFEGPLYSMRAEWDAGRGRYKLYRGL